MELIVKAKDIFLEYAGRDILDIEELEIYSYDRIGLGPAALDFFTICHRSEILLEGGEVFSAPAARERRKHIFTHTHFILYENAR